MSNYQLKKDLHHLKHHIEKHEVKDDDERFLRIKYKMDAIKQKMILNSKLIRPSWDLEVIARENKKFPKGHKAEIISLADWKLKKQGVVTSD